MTLEEAHRARKREYNKKYREAHKKQMKAYRLAHREEINAYQRERYKHSRKNLPIGRPKAIFALYKGDEFLDIGDKYELAEKFGLTPNFISWSGTPSAKKSFYEHGATGYTVVNLTSLEDIDL